MFTSMISKMKGGSSDESGYPAKPDIEEVEKEEKAKADVTDQQPIKPVIVAPSSDEAIVIDKKAVKQNNDSKSPGDISEYEKKLMKRFQK